MFFKTKPVAMPHPDDVLAGRADPIPTASRHYVNDHALHGPYPEGSGKIVFGMGCFWGAERAFWSLPGVYVTAVGYAGGSTPNPTYGEVCSGLTGHNEVVLVVYEPDGIAFEALVKTFWEGHDPTQGMRQGNDVGTQYRSGIYTYTEAQKRQAKASRDAYAANLAQAGYGPVTTEIADAGPFYFAEADHQQYLAKNPMGYCGLGGTGIACPGAETAV